MSRSILVIAGLNREAALARGPGVEAVAGGGSRTALEQRLAALDPSSYAAVVSFGFAGALDHALPVGMLVVPTRVIGDGEAYDVAASIRSTWLGRIGDDASLPIEIAGVGIPVLKASAKRDLALRTGASAVDMESHVAAAFAKRRGLPFGALRVISDPADRDLPDLAGTAMRPDGSVDVLGVAAGLLRQPHQLPALLRTARDASRAFRTLSRVRGLLGIGLGLHL